MCASIFLYMHIHVCTWVYMDAFTRIPSVWRCFTTTWPGRQSQGLPMSWPLGVGRLLSNKKIETMFNVFVWALWVLVNPYKPALLWFRQAETNVVILSYRLSTHDSSVWISIEAAEFWGTSHFRWIHKKSRFFQLVLYPTACVHAYHHHHHHHHLHHHHHYFLIYLYIYIYTTYILSLFPNFPNSVYLIHSAKHIRYLFLLEHLALLLVTSSLNGWPWRWQPWNRTSKTSRCRCRAWQFRLEDVGLFSSMIYPFTWVNRHNSMSVFMLNLLKAVLQAFASYGIWPVSFWFNDLPPKTGALWNDRRVFVAISTWHSYGNYGPFSAMM